MYGVGDPGEARKRYLDGQTLYQVRHLIQYAYKSRNFGGPIQGPIVMRMDGRRTMKNVIA